MYTFQRGSGDKYQRRSGSQEIDRQKIVKVYRNMVGGAFSAEFEVDGVLFHREGLTMASVIDKAKREYSLRNMTVDELLNYVDESEATVRILATWLRSYRAWFQQVAQDIDAHNAELGDTIKVREEPTL